MWISKYRYDRLRERLDVLEAAVSTLRREQKDGCTIIDWESVPAGSWVLSSGQDPYKDYRVSVTSVVYALARHLGVKIKVKPAGHTPASVELLSEPKKRPADK